MKKRNAARLAQTSVGSFLWLIVLAPILGISAYSMYWIARHLGVPPLIAVGMSTCFDGVVLLAAGYALRYAQAGLSGAVPRAVVLAWAALAAYIQTFHARIGHEPAGSWLLWASLPIAAVLVYEIHVRWARRAALARAGRPYPAPLPSLGVVTWLMFPYKTWFSLRAIAAKRRDVIVDSALKSPVLARVVEKPPVVKATITDVRPNDADKEVRKGQAEVRRINEQRKVRGPNRHAPTRHIRDWAKEQGLQVGDRAKLPQTVLDAYDAAHREAGGDT